MEDAGDRILLRCTVQPCKRDFSARLRRDPRQCTVCVRQQDLLFRFRHPAFDGRDRLQIRTLVFERLTGICHRRDHDSVDLHALSLLHAEHITGRTVFCRHIGQLLLAQPVIDHMLHLLHLPLCRSVQPGVKQCHHHQKTDRQHDRQDNKDIAQPAALQASPRKTADVSGSIVCRYPFPSPHAPHLLSMIFPSSIRMMRSAVWAISSL